jgi:triosephosphate isomerase
MTNQTKPLVNGDIILYMKKKIPIHRVKGPTKKMYLVANWKMNPSTLKTARSILVSGLKAIKNSVGLTLVVCPPAPYLGLLARNKRPNVFFGAQNVHHELEGSFTGEFAAPHVAEVRGQFAIIGHAERRAMGETNEQIAKKMFECCTSHLTPILCVGETERDARGDYLHMLREQIVSAFTSVPQSMRAKCMIAYEPVYAIGATHPPSVHDIHQTILVIKKVLIEVYGGSVARSVPVLYGGAVDETTIREIVKGIPECSGVLVGRASTDPLKLAAMINALGR